MVDKVQEGGIYAIEWIDYDTIIMVGTCKHQLIRALRPYRMSL